jgi:hypothetical protein
MVWKWSKQNIWYYGVRYAKKCHPDELWKSYFTSSKYVQLFREMNGDPDIVQIRKTFKDKDSARTYERKVLVRLNVVNEEKWLNKTDNISIDSSIVSRRQRERVANGDHLFCGENNPSKIKSRKDIHPWQDSEKQRQLTIRNNTARLQNGSHNFKISWKCECCGKEGKNQINYLRWHGDKCKFK